ncbi:MAG: ATP phosphoribosyltransferase regulatory subunit [Alphaproteobacteria bacterium]|nr:ATP phosphoribosyltransferase regulatory subunit [Alphaproteobacteria bacterium]
MSMNEKAGERALLPSGFEDLLPPHAQREYQAIGTLMSAFGRFGYERVKPPLAEFEESLMSTGPGAALSQETFRVMDPVSHRMMGLRSDITAQIARIAVSRLPGASRPLRLTYANDVIRTRASQQRTLRQFTQVGCEMIGTDDADSDVEIVIVALNGLASLALGSVSIDFAVPRLLEAVLESYGMDPAQRRDLCRRLQSRDEQVLETVEDLDLRAILQGLLHASGASDRALPKLEALDLPGAAASLAARLRDVVTGIEKAAQALGLGGVSLTIDPLESRGFEYHDGVAFTFFSKDVRGELGRGGRYRVPGGQGADTSAAGFTFYMDTLRQAMKDETLTQRIYVPKAEGWSCVKMLQDAGWVVIRGADERPSTQDFKAIYKNGKIQEI